MEETMFYFSISLLFLLVALTLHLSKLRGKLLPPSPPALPILGHLHLLKSALPMHRLFYSLSQKYGPIMSLRFGSRLVVVVSSLPAVEECFTKNDIVFANRPKLLLAKHLEYNYTTLIQAPYGDHWRNLRRLGAVEIFSTQRLNMFLSIRKDEIKRLLMKLATDGRRAQKSSMVVEMKSLFQELTFNIMMRMVAGKSYYGDDVSDEEEAKQFKNIMNDTLPVSGASNPGDFLPLMNWIDGGDFEKKVTAIGKRMDKFLQGLIDEHRRKGEDSNNKQNTMIHHLLSLQQSDPEYHTDEIIKGFILVILLAGTDTSAVTLEWALSNLLNHPDILKKARDELDNQVGQECLLEESHLSKLHYLHSIISESHRLCPAVPLLVPHYSSDDCTVGSYNVPRGTILLVNAWAIHRDPTLWDDPTKFKPERFDNEEGECRKLMPFGLGRRSCPGEGLAQRVVGLTLGSLIQCFDWERVSENEIDMTEARAVTLQKVQPLEVICKARPIINNILA